MAVACCSTMLHLQLDQHTCKNDDERLQLPSNPFSGSLWTLIRAIAQKGLPKKTKIFPKKAAVLQAGNTKQIPSTHGWFVGQKRLYG